MPKKREMILVKFSLQLHCLEKSLKEDDYLWQSYDSNILKGQKCLSRFELLYILLKVAFFHLCWY